MSTEYNIQQVQASIEAARNEIAKVLVGQTEMVHLLFTALLAEGHVLIEGVPGVAKTLAAKLVAQTMQVPFSRIQFTPDLMPSDILGTSVFNPKTTDFQFKKGPIFSNLVLIDEINRSPAKTQAALFEVMEEKQVTNDGTSMPMNAPFMVLATQNPIEQEGTYRLPEAQLDRFLFKIEVGYPNLEEEVKILEHTHQGLTAHFSKEVAPVFSATDIVGFQALVSKVYIEPHVLQFIANLIQQTRNHKFLYLGASPRASVAILKAAKASAAIAGRDFVTPDDVIRVAHPVLCHRLMLTPEKEMEGVTIADVIQNIIQKIEVPR
ncbi:MAG: AAA family ATPase [Chitinophagaceae bacterium]